MFDNSKRGGNWSFPVIMDLHEGFNSDTCADYNGYLGDVPSLSNAYIIFTRKLNTNAQRTFGSASI